MSKFLNAIGIYTRKDVEVKNGRIRQLWKMTNECNAFVDTYGRYLKRECGDDEKIKEVIRRMDELADKTYTVLFDNISRDF